MSKKKIYRAGVLPYFIKNEEIKILFMKPSEPKYGGDAFQIAKGKQEEGETIEETGLREGNEELGLFSGNIKNIYNLGKFLGRTQIFICEIEDPDMFGDPHHETGEVKWMTPEEFHAKGRDLHKPVVKAAVRFIEKQKHTITDNVNWDQALSNVKKIKLHETKQNLDTYYIHSYAHHDKWLSEAPQLTSDDDFGYTDTTNNQQQAQQILDRTDLEKLGAENQVSIFQFWDGEDGFVVAIDMQKTLILFIVKFSIEQQSPVTTPVIVQHEIWKGVDTRVEHMPSQLFDYLLNFAGGIMTDAWHTKDGQKFWLSQANKAIEMSNRYVYYVNLDKSQTIKELTDPRHIREYTTLWSADRSSTNERLLITTSKII